MKKIVISGTYCTGKTTLSLALANATGIPTTHALTMREILPQLYPGKTLRQCNFAELLTLGMKRFEDRIRTESALSAGFISDGCPLQEWLYGSTRLITGAYPDEYPWQMYFKKIYSWHRYQDFKKLLRGFEGLAKQYTLSAYDTLIHLPLAFPFVPDGHRPTSERFRQVSEKRLIKTYSDMGIKPFVISGSITQRLEKILELLALDPRLPLDQCIQQAVDHRHQRFDTIQLEK